MSSSNIVQYVIIRSDLRTVLKWPLGALIAQACHACTAVVHLYYSDAHTQEYLADLDRMHKVVLEIPNEEAIRKLSETLAVNSVDHKLWIEQPENIPTCLVLKPYPKEQVQSYLKHLKLCKG